MEWFPFISSTLGLSHNHLTGSVPNFTGTSFSDMVGVVDLSHNQLSGELPPWIGINQVALLNMSHNFLEGTLPSSWRSMLLTTLDLSNNQLSGSIDGWNGAATNLYLQHNNLTGDAHFINGVIDGGAAMIDLSNNHFSGELPRMEYANNYCSYSANDPTCSCSLNLRNNDFTGGIPVAFCDLLSMSTYLEGNCLTNTTVPRECHKYHSCGVIPGMQRSC